MKHRFSSIAAILSLTIVPLTGCGEDGSAITDTISTSAACADVVEMSVGDLRDIKKNIDNPDEIAQALRQMASDFEQKASQVDDAQLREGVEAYAAKVKELARAAESGETPDIDALVQANSDLADACI